MPATGFSRIAPGDAATAASLANKLTGVRDAINDLPLEAVEPHSLTRQHFPSMIVGTPGRAVLQNAVSAESEYSSQAGAEPYPGWNTVAGWKVVNDVGTATGPNTLRVSGLGVALDANTSIEVWASVEVVDIILWDYTAGPPTTISADVAGAARIYACFAIQYSNDAATWYHLARTERYLDAETTNDATNLVGATIHHDEAQQNKRCTIATRIRNTDPGGSITVNYVRMVVSCHRGNFALGTQHCRVRLRQGSIDVIGKRHGTLT